MASPAALDTNVMISQELRNIIACRRRQNATCIQTCSDQSTAALQIRPELSVNAPRWAQIKLRRDAERPFVFDGLNILQFSRPMQLGDVECLHTVSLYLCADQTFQIALNLDVPHDAPARSSYRVFPIRNMTLNKWIVDWCADLCVVAQSLRRPLNQSTDLREMQDVFHQMTSYCFRFEKF